MKGQEYSRPNIGWRLVPQWIMTALSVAGLEVLGIRVWTQSILLQCQVPVGCVVGVCFMRPVRRVSRLLLVMCHGGSAAAFDRARPLTEDLPRSSRSRVLALGGLLRRC